jgi:hypothetical protein
MDLKEHLTSSGFETILSYYASINNGISNTVKISFPNIISVFRINPILPNLLNPH